MKPCLAAALTALLLAGCVTPPPGSNAANTAGNNAVVSQGPAAGTAAVPVDANGVPVQTTTPPRAPRFGLGIGLGSWGGRGFGGLGIGLGF